MILIKIHSVCCITQPLTSAVQGMLMHLHEHIIKNAKTHSASSQTECEQLLPVNAHIQSKIQVVSILHLPELMRESPPDVKPLVSRCKCWQAGQSKALNTQWRGTTVRKSATQLSRNTSFKNQNWLCNGRIVNKIIFKYPITCIKLQIDMMGKRSPTVLLYPREMIVLNFLPRHV